MNRFPIAFVAAAAMTFSGSSIALAKDWTKITIATEGAYPPYNTVEASGKLAGYDVDVSNELCKRMKAECEIVAQDWDGIIPALNAGKYDAIVAAMVPTPERAEAVDFTRPYALMQLSFMTSKQNPLAKIGASETSYSLDTDAAGVEKAVAALKPLLQGKIVGVQTSTTQVQFLEKYFAGVVEVREYKTTDAIVLDLASGRIDATLDGAGFLGGVIASPQGKDLELVGPRFGGGLFGGDSCIALRKADTDLTEKFNAALESAVADGTLAKLSTKWFGTDIAPKK